MLDGAYLLPDGRGWCAWQGVGDVRRLTKNLEEVSLRLQGLDTMQRSNMRAIHGKAARIDTARQA